MGFSKKIKDYFDSKGLSNREVSNIMDGYSESMISKYLNKDDISITFIEKLSKYFPEIDLNYLIKEEDVYAQVNEERDVYKKRTVVLLEEIEGRLSELKKIVSQ